MKILIQVNELEGEYSAVANIARLLIKELSKTNEVVVVSYDNLRNNYVSREKHDIFDELRWYYFDTIHTRQLIEFYKMTNWLSKNKFEKFFYFFKSPKRVIQSIDISKFDQRGTVKKSVVLLEEVVKLEKPDVVITFVIPYIMAEILAKAKIDRCIKKIIYQLDPFAENYSTPKNYYKRRLKLEKWCNKNVDYILVMKILYILYKKTLYEDIIEKVVPLELPCVRKIFIKNREKVVFDEKKVNCVFIGTLYEKIRNPEFMLNLFSKLEDKRVILHFWGIGCEELLKKYKEFMGDSLEIHGVIPSDMAEEVMLEADILINICNTIQNQTSSKLFDYISTGKPIISFVKAEDDISREYLNKYPLALQIYEFKGNIQSDVSLVKDFCIENRGKKLSYRTIESLYKECTIEYVTNKIVKLITEK